MPPDERFPRVVSLACHDLRTPLATIYGFARTLTRADELDERSQRFLSMIEQAAEQMTGLLDELGTAARIQSGRWEPGVREVATLELASSDDERIAVVGHGVTIETEADVVGRSLQALATAALVHGPAEQVTWRVEGRSLELAPITEAASAVVTGTELRDLGSLVARYVLEELGGSIELDGETLRVRL
jgi:light-regulated signal transduction histidine kinase (bacteriophytochrome)